MLKALRGTKDIIPQDVGIWQKIEALAREIFTIYNYKEIRTPIIEDASLFIRSIGDTSDIVQKEMYTFSDRGKRQIALRPEATASIVRSFIENSLGKDGNLIKLFYIGAMFRSERPQKGRQRQFHQLGVEAIGSDSPFLDVEVMLLSIKFLERLGIKDFQLKINSLGCHKDKLILIDKYKKSIKPYLGSLCDECNVRYNKNVLRTLDCKNPECINIVGKLAIKDFLCSGCVEHFATIRKVLEDLKVNYVLDSKIVRGLDYYTKTVFEITQKDLGAKDALCAGGRYNNLVKDMGGGPTPAVGFAFGIERLILAFKEKTAQLASLDVVIATTTERLHQQAFMLTNSLRDEGVLCDIDYKDKSLKTQLSKAEKMQAKFVIIFGEDEFREDKVLLKDMKKRTQKEILLKDITRIVKSEFRNR